MAFDPQAATAQYIDGLGADALAKAAAYTHGEHWLLLWGLAVSALVTWLIVRSGVLNRVSGKLQQRGPNLRAFVVGVVFFLATTLLTLPWTLYESWWREMRYGRTSQPLTDFLGQGTIAMLLTAVLGALFIVGVYALIRRAGRAWWIWSAGLAAVASAALLLAAPILIEPLFNTFKPVPAGEVRDALVVMAQRAGVPADRIFVFDGSRQSNNFTANVAGLAGSARIAISDVAFKGASLDEVKAVTGHEIGHYVLGHVWRAVGVTAGLADTVLLPGGPVVSSLRARLRQQRLAVGSRGAAGPDLHGVAVRAAGTAGAQCIEPRRRDGSRSLFARERESSRCAGLGAGEDRGVSQPATHAARGGPVL